MTRAAWVHAFGIGPAGPVEVIDSDITTMSAAADKVIRVGGGGALSREHRASVELSERPASGRSGTGRWRPDYRHGLPVITVLVLLRPEANSPALTGTYERLMPDGRLTNRYDYHVVRVWREKAKAFLEAGIGLVPLAPLADVKEAELPEVVSRMAERLKPCPGPGPPSSGPQRTCCWACDSRKSRRILSLKGLETMRESTTYQKILSEGRRPDGKRDCKRPDGKREGRRVGRKDATRGGWSSA